MTKRDIVALAALLVLAPVSIWAAGPVGESLTESLAVAVNAAMTMDGYGGGMSDLQIQLLQREGSQALMFVAAIFWIAATVSYCAHRRHPGLTPFVAAIGMPALLLATSLFILVILPAMTGHTDFLWPWLSILAGVLALWIWVQLRAWRRGRAESTG